MFGKSFRCHAPFGMVNRRHIALKSEHAAFCANGTFKILIQIQQKNANWPKRLVWHQHKLAIGSKIEGNEIERLLPKTGTFFHLLFELTFDLSNHLWKYLKIVLWMNLLCLQIRSMSSVEKSKGKTNEWSHRSLGSVF